MSEEAASWAEKIKVGNARAKSVLMRLGAFADSEGVAWAAVPTLADRLECDDRTIQRALRFLEKHGFIRNTGRFRHKCVPYYQLDLTGVQRAAWLAANGDILSPLAGAAGGPDCHPKGDTDVTQNKGNNPGEGSSEPSPGQAGAGAVDVCQMAFEAFPEAGRKGPSSIRLWRAAWASEMAGGASDLAMLAGVRGYAADRKAWGASGRPKTAHVWLADGCWEAFANDAPAAAQGGPSAVLGWPGPAHIRAAVAKAQSEAFAGATLDAASWNGVAIVARTRWAADQLRTRAKAVLAELGVEVLNPP